MGVKYTHYIIYIILSLLILSFTSNPAFANHGPKWIELHSPKQIFAIAVDSDNDGIFNWREKMLGTDSDSADSDGDGFNDVFEDNYRAFGFDPLKRNTDTDSDGLTDTFERNLGTSIYNQDSDGDMLSDFDEVMNRRFGYHPLKRTRDSDFDGLTDRLENRLGSSPRNPDTNNDGINDFEAYYEGINPRRRFEEGHFGEIIGSTYSSRMQKAIEEMRSGAEFPAELAVELPYPAVTRRLYGSGIRGTDATLLLSEAGGHFLSPSAAMLQSGLAASKDIFYVTALYPTYNEIVTQIKNIALAFDGSPKPKIVRLFYWSEPTDGHRWIYALKISDNPDINEEETEMLFMGLHHGRELITASYTMALIRKLTNGYAAGKPAMQARVNTTEIWIIPIVNPDGYAMAQSEFAQGANVNWRKNTRKVLELSTSGLAQTENTKGVDPNRNYDYSHIRTLPLAKRLALGPTNCIANGLNGLLFQECEEFDTRSSTYAGGLGFSEVESRSVRMLADNQFTSGDEIDSLRCSVSWHTGGAGAIIAPINHASPGTVSITDQVELEKLGNAYAVATGYYYYYDAWWTYLNHYQAFGTSDNWLYTHNGILPLTIEALAGYKFFESTFAKKKAAVDLNMKGAMAFMHACGPLRYYLPLP